MTDLAAFSVEAPASPTKTKTWSSVEYALALLAFMLSSSVMVTILNYYRLEGSLKLWISWEQPDFFRPSPDESLWVRRTIVERAAENGAVSSEYKRTLGFEFMSEVSLVVTEATASVCLDGSLPAYHLDKGRGLGANNWLIHLEGGGWCSSKKSCLHRSQTRLGSSHFMDEQIIFGGSLSDSPLKNPEFYNWNRVKVRYCDGGSFSGDIDKHVEVTLENSNQVKKIYFRGQRVWQAVMDDLLAIGMNKAKKAILSGCSAGGLAAILHCDNFRHQLPDTAIVKCLSDAGIFLDIQDVGKTSTIRSFYKDVVSVHGIATQLPEECKKNRDIEQCFFAQYLLKTIKTPLFILNPAYDTWQINNTLVPASADPSGKWNFCKADPAECSIDQLKVFQEFRVKLLEAIEAVEGSEDGGLFINSCFVHCQSEFDMTWHRGRTPTIKQRTISETVGDWFYKRKPTKDIDCAYPCNPTCFKIGIWGNSLK